MTTTAATRTTTQDNRAEQMRQAREEAARQARIEAQREAQRAAQREAQRETQRTATANQPPKVELHANDTFQRAERAEKPTDWVNRLGSTQWPDSARDSGVGFEKFSRTGAPAAAQIDEEKVDEAEERVQDIGGTELADQLRSENLSQEEKRELIDRAINSENAEDLLTDFEHIQEERNYDYDDAQTVATAIEDAHDAGNITDQELRTFAERLGPEESAEFAAQLALDPANTRPGGVVEAYGRQAEALGQDQAAAVAFSSSQALIDANLRTDAEQQAAFEQVREFVEQDRDDFSNEEQAAFTVAAGNAVRLSANGNGYSQDELRSFAEDLGPSLTGEVIARARNTPGDRGVGGAVDLLGQASRDIAADAEGDAKEEWELNSAVAFTASNALIDEHLQGEAGLRAFQTLTDAAHEGYETFKDAEGEYSLLRLPEITEGAAKLFGARTEDIIQAAITPGEGIHDQGHLQKFFESTAFSPFSTPEVKQDVRARLTDWAEYHVQVSGHVDEGQLAKEVGVVFGIAQNAADAAVDRVGDDEEARVEAQNDANDFLTSLGGAVAGSAVGLYNPILGAVTSPVVKEILEEVLPQQDVAEARAAAEEMFRQELERQGSSADLGRILKAVQEDYLGRVQDAILNQRQRGNLTPEEERQLGVASDTLALIQQRLDDGYSQTRGLE